MIHRVVIRDNKRTPISFLYKVKAFKNGREFIFKPGVNIIVGENGCGKTTLLDLIRSYLLVDSRECSAGKFNCNILSVYNNFIDKKLLDGADVYADYVRNTFRLLHKDEKTNDDINESGKEFFAYFEQLHSSTGESVAIALQSLFNHMYSKGAKLSFDYSQFNDLFPDYVDYVAGHMVKGDEWTILMDEPDRNLSISKIMEIKGILDFHKPQTQILCVVHNPLLICALSKVDDVNVIEMTRGYVSKVRKMVNELIK